MTLINYSQLSHLWKILVGSGLIMHANSGTPAVLQVTNPANVKTFELLSNGYESFSGSLLSKSGSNVLHWDSPNNRLGVGKRDPKTTLDVAGAVSGSLLTLSSMRTCTLKTSGTGNVTCGTDIDTNTTYTAAQGLTLLGGTAFRLNAAITGSTLQVSTSLASSGTLVWETSASGATLWSSTIRAGSSLNSSGSLTWEGTASGARLWVSAMSGAGLSSCTGGNALRWSAGKFSCAADAGTTYTAAQGLTLIGGSAFRVNATLTGTLVNFQTVSGSTVFAKNLLTSSGTLTTESGAYFDSNTLVILAGPNRVGIGTLLPKTSLEVVGTISGAIVNATTLSGSIVRANQYSSRFLSTEVVSTGSTVTVGSGKVMLVVPSSVFGASSMSGYKLSAVGVSVLVAGTTNGTCFQIRDLDKGGRKMLSTPACIDSGTTNSASSGTPFVVLAANSDVGAGDRLVVDITSVSTTAPKVPVITLMLVKP